MTGKPHGTVKTVPYKPAGNLHFSPLYLTSHLFVGRGFDPSLLFCGYRKFPRRGGVTPPYGAIQNHHPVGAGHAPPATVYYNEHNGSSVGTATMPPVATIRILRTIGQTARNGQDRSLQTYRKSHTQHKIHHPVGAVIDRPCSHPVNETQRVNATGEQCSPLQAKGKFAPTALHRTL